MQKWQYLDVVWNFDNMADSTGRHWDVSVAKAIAGVVQTRRGDKAIELIWRGPGTGLANLGEEGWELVGILPNMVNLKVGDEYSSAHLLIFKRPKP